MMKHLSPHKNLKLSNVYSSDDGTNISITIGSSTILKYRKSDGQILVDAGVESDAY